MQINRYAIELAVLRVFRDYRASHAGASLFLGGMHEAWANTGLRERDLDSGIEFLREARCLRTDPYPATDDVLVTLLPEGASRLETLPHRLGEWMHLVGSAWSLRAAARRRVRGFFWLRWRGRLHGFKGQSDMQAN